MKTISSYWPQVRNAIPTELLGQSGKVFYSGRQAFSAPSSLYVLGLNPGGDPEKLSTDSIAKQADWVSAIAPEDWSAYRDESWQEKPPGRHGMQPRVLHLFRSIGLQPGAVPSSNLVFVRSRRERDIASSFGQLADMCWPFHRFVIATLRPKVVLCFGQRAGGYIRRQTEAIDQYACFTENNNRKWQTKAYRSAKGLKVIVTTHPSIADWTAEDTDPSSIVRDALHDA